MAKSILDIAKAATAELQLPIPTVALTSTDSTVKQIIALTVAACDELVEDFDWQALLATYTFNTAVSTSLYSLPSDYARLLGNTAWNRTAAWPIEGSDSPQRFQALKSGIVNVGPYYRFRIIGNKFELLPVPTESTTTLAINYISRAYVLDGSTGAAKTTFTADSDTTVFADRLVINFVKLKLLQIKGFDTTAATQDFNSSYAAAIGQDTPAPNLMMTPRVPLNMLSLGNVRDGSWS